VLDRFLFLKRQAPGIWRQARFNKIRLQSAGNHRDRSP